MQVARRILVVVLLAPLYILAVKLPLPPGELVELRDAEFQGHGRRNFDFLSEPARLDLSLSLGGGGHKDPHPKTPNWISSKIYHVNQASVEEPGAFTQGLEAQSSLRPLSLSNNRPIELDFLGLSTKRKISDSEPYEPFRTRNPGLQSDQLWNTLEPIQYKSGVENGHESQIELNLSLGYPKKRPKFGWLSRDLDKSKLPSGNQEQDYVAQHSFESAPRQKTLALFPDANNEKSGDQEVGSRIEEAHSNSFKDSTPENRASSSTKQPDTHFEYLQNSEYGQKLAFYDELDPDKTLAMICGTAVYMAEPDEQKFRSNKNPSILKSFKTFYPKIHQIMVEECSVMESIKQIPNFYNILYQFNDLIWIINLRLLKFLDNLSEGEYLEKTNSIPNWFIGFLNKSEKGKKASLTSENMDETWNNNVLKEVIESLYQACNFKISDQKMYSVQKKKNLQIGAISEKQVLITKAVLKILNCYYASENLEKLRNIVPNEKKFISLIASIQFERLKGEVLEMDDLILSDNSPEKNPLNGRVDNFVRRCYNLERYYVLEITEGNIDKFEEGRQDLVIPNFARKFTHGVDKHKNEFRLVDSYLLLYHAYEGMRISEKFNPDYLTRGLRELYTNQQRSTFKEISNGQLIYFGNVVWLINGKLIESLGNVTHGQIYMREQELAQKSILDVLTLYEVNQGFPSSKSSESARFISRLIIEAVPQRDKLAELKWSMTPTNNLIKLSQAAARFLSYHYYQENPEKWLTVFHNENQFFHSLRNIYRRIRCNPGYQQFLLKSFPSISETRLIPWRMPSSLTQAQCKTVMVIHRAKDSA